MNIYKELAINDLYAIYHTKPELRRSIVTFLGSLPEAKRQEFFNLDKLHEFSPVVKYQQGRILKGSEKEKIKALLSSKERGYYSRFKASLADQLKKFEGDDTLTMMYLGIEYTRQKEIYDHIFKQYGKNENDKEFINYLISDLGRSIHYINRLANKARNSAFGLIHKWDELGHSGQAKVNNVESVVGVENNPVLSLEDEELQALKRATEIYKPIFTTIPHQAVLALFYYYLHLAKLEPWFESYPKRKVAHMHALAKIIGVGPKNFELAYNAITSPKKDNRKKVKNRRNLNTLIPLLQKFLPAQELAIKDYKDLEFL